VDKPRAVSALNTSAMLMTRRKGPLNQGCIGMLLDLVCQLPCGCSTLSLASDDNGHPFRHRTRTASIHWTLASGFEFEVARVCSVPPPRG
jgi:hypothetical protein